MALSVTCLLISYLREGTSLISQVRPKPGSIFICVCLCAQTWLNTLKTFCSELIRLVMTVFKMTLTIQVVLLATFSVLAAEDLSFKAGHLEPFGFGKTTPIEEVNNFPKPMEFFENYVWPLKPLKMKGAAKISKAFSKWTDDYFLSLRSLDKEKVTVETRKKESRQQEVLSMSFTDFIKTYNNTENYMVESVPSPVRYILCYIVEYRRNSSVS